MKIITGPRKKLEIKGANLITEKIRQLLKTQDKVVIAIPGGRSVNGIFMLLKHQRINWEKVHIFMVDERLVALDSPQSNFRQAWDTFVEYLVKQFKLPRENMHPYIYFKVNDQEGATAYKEELKEIADCFDIVLLSSGESGEIASLFPNHGSIRNTSEFFFTMTNSKRFPRERMTSSRDLISRSKMAILLFFGESKRNAYQNFLNPNGSIKKCPARIVRNIEESYAITDLK